MDFKLADLATPSVPISAPAQLVVMGMACRGKSSLAQRCAQALEPPMVEGDDFHCAANVAKMRAGQSLNDADRHEWLDAWDQQLCAHPSGVVLTCSALGKRYRERLRNALSGLRFVHLTLTGAQDLRRVAARTDQPDPAGLVASQFETLEDPRGGGAAGRNAVDWGPAVERQ